MNKIKTLSLREKISDLLVMFNCDDLMQVHKSFAISKRRIKSIEGNRMLIADFIVPIGKIYKSTVLQLVK